MKNSEKQLHTIPPVYNGSSRILILGSFPSEKSRESGFFYGHRQNRFWRVLAMLYNTDTPQTNDEKREFLLRHNIALWDVLAECEIVGSSDASIKNEVPNDIPSLLRDTAVEKIFTNGKTAHSLYVRHLQPQANIEAVCLPSTSPANAQWSLDRLCEAWSVILN